MGRDAAGRAPLRASRAAPVLPVLLERRAVPDESPEIRSASRVLQEERARRDGRGPVCSTSPADSRQALPDLRGRDAELRSARGAQQQSRARVPARGGERRHGGAPHEQRARLHRSLVRLLQAGLLRGLPQHQHQIQIPAALLQLLRSQTAAGGSR